MTLDVFSVSVMSALVAGIASIMFIVETLRRRDTGSGRLWAVAYLAGMFTTLAYVAWASGYGGVLTIGLANALFVLTPGFIWLGNLRYNDRPLTWAAVTVGAGAVIAFAAAAAGLGHGADWSGWEVLVVILVGLFVAGGVEAARAPMGRLGNARVFAGILFTAGAYYAARLVAYVVDGGPDGAFFSTWFGAVSANIATVTLTMTAVVVTSVLRATKSNVQRYEWLSENGVAADGILLARTYRGALGDMIERADWRGELASVVVVQIEGLAEMTAAFGTDATDEITRVSRQAVRRYAPASAFVGEVADGSLSLCCLAATAADARRQAAMVYRGCVDELSRNPTGLLPVVGVGVAITEMVGYDPDRLVDAARTAAERASRSLEASVLFGGLDDMRSRLA